MLSSAARQVEFNQPEKRVLAKEVAHGWFRFTRCKRSTWFSVSAQAPILFIYIDSTSAVVKRHRIGSAVGVI